MKIVVNRADMTLAQDSDVWNDQFIALLRSEGFTMKGGVYIGLEMHRKGEVIAFDYVPVARREIPMKGNPNCFAESLEPRFMNSCAFRNKVLGSSNWGADFINNVIATNDGYMPQSWLAIAFDSSEAATGSV